MKRKKLTLKQKTFVDHYTDKNNPVTFGNGLQSAKVSYNVNKDITAANIASENLNKPYIINVIDKKLLKKEELQAKQSNLVRQLEDYTLENKLTRENIHDVIPAINQLGINIERNAKINGDLIDRIESININIEDDKLIEQALNAMNVNKV